MIVDDSSVYRNLLREVLNSDPEIEVIAQAVNGRLALPRIRHYKPEILLLDNEMPEMTGLETLEALGKDFPQVGVIMFSSHTVEGARVTIKALELGALDFVTKPRPEDGDAKEYIRKNLIARLKSIISQRGRTSVRDRAKAGLMGDVRSGAPIVYREPPPPSLSGVYDACAIGISTGGPAALRDLLSGISASIKGSLFIVQHMPPLFTRQLAESLDAISPLKVVEGEEDMPVQPGHAYIAPGGKHMVLERENGSVRIKILDTPPENNCKPSVNVLFRSVAAVYGGRAMGVIMTGMGNDGYEGIKEMKQASSYLVAQSEQSCLVFGMPAAPVREKLVREVLDLKDIAVRIKSLLGGG